MRRREATISGDVTGTTEHQVAENRVAVNLSGKDFEHWRERQEVLREAKNSPWSTALNQLCMKRQLHALRLYNRAEYHEPCKNNGKKAIMSTNKIK